MLVTWLYVRFFMLVVTIIYVSACILNRTFMHKIGLFLHTLYPPYIKYLRKQKTEGAGLKSTLRGVNVQGWAISRGNKMYKIAVQRLFSVALFIVSHCKLR